MLFSIALLIVIIYLAFRLAPVEKKEHAHIHGAGQIVGKWTEGGWVVLISFSSLRSVTASQNKFIALYMTKRVFREQWLRLWNGNRLKSRNTGMACLSQLFVSSSCSVFEPQTDLSRLCQPVITIMHCMLTIPKPHPCFNSISTTIHRNPNWVVRQNKPLLVTRRDNQASKQKHSPGCILLKTSEWSQTPKAEHLHLQVL